MLKVVLHQREPVVLDVEFSCGQNQLVTLVGPSGSGKTTILRCIAGLHHADSGLVQNGKSVLWDGTNRIRVPTYQRNVGMVFQNYALFPHLDVFDNVAISLHQHVKHTHRDRVRSILELVNLSGFEKRFPNQLSGGQQQRVALARALAGDPDLLLLDEPFSAVDLVTRRKLRRDLARIRKGLNIPIIMVTHDLDEAYELSDVMVVLYHGKTLVTAPPREVMRRPPASDIARLLGHNNIYQGTVVDHDLLKYKTIIKWQSAAIECRYCPEFEPGQNVNWMIPANQVLLHQTVRPSNGERENPIMGRLDELIVLGDFVSLSVVCLDNESQMIRFSVPLHVAERNQLSEGGSVKVSLVSDGIHLMKR